jgi:hypothetical protein
VSTAASTDDAGSGTDGDVRNTAVVADTAAAAAAAAGAGAVAAAAVGVDDDDHGDADDDTSRYCIHPCHVPESRFTGSNASAIRRKKRNGTHTDGKHINHLSVERDRLCLESVVGRHPRHFRVESAMSFGIIAIKHASDSNSERRGRRFAK